MYRFGQLYLPLQGIVNRGEGVHQAPAQKPDKPDNCLVFTISRRQSEAEAPTSRRLSSPQGCKKTSNGTFHSFSVDLALSRSWCPHARFQLEEPTGALAPRRSQRPPPEGPARASSVRLEGAPACACTTHSTTTLAEIEGPGVIQHIWIYG